MLETSCDWAVILGKIAYVAIFPKMMQISTARNRGLRRRNFEKCWAAICADFGKIAYVAIFPNWNFAAWFRAKIKPHSKAFLEIGANLEKYT